MEIQEFIEVTGEIEKFYGEENKPKELNSTERRIWFEELKKISKERYRQVVREVFRNCKYYPKLADIIALEKTLPKENKNVVYETVECVRCGSRGVIEINYKNDNLLWYSFAAKCTCQNARKYENFPSITNYQVKNIDGRYWLIE
jgi:hypothetical protein